MPSRPQPRTDDRQYWVFAANPRVYDIENAAQTLSVDLWTTKGKDVRAGDRIIIWKYKGSDAYRGVVALGEVIADPDIQPDNENRYWIKDSESELMEERVEVRYVLPPGVPLWMTSNPDDPLRRLSVSRAAGGTVFYVTEPQWKAVLAAVGGWPEPDSG
jgi:hypothetical protein